MSLIPIDSQPIKMSLQTNSQIIPKDLIAESFCEPCVDEPPYCQKFATYDQLFLQMKNEPDLSDFPGNDCNVFVDFITDEYNGEFEKGGGWGFSGDQWCMNTSGSTSVLSIPLSIFTSTDGEWYILNVEFDGVTGGSVEVRFGTDVLGVITSSGVYTFTFLSSNATDQLNFSASTEFVGCFISYDVSSINSGWGFSYFEIDVENCGFCVMEHDPGIEPTLIVDYELESDFDFVYNITFEIRNRTAGEVFLESVISPGFNMTTFVANGNGFFSHYTEVYAMTKMQFRASEDFDGCIYNIKIYTQCRRHRIKIFDKNNDVVGVLSVQYDGNFLTVPPFEPYFHGANIVGDCYKIGIIDGCKEKINLITDGNFSNGQWNMEQNASIVDDELYMQGSIDPSVASYDYSGLGIDCNKCFIIEIHISEFIGEVGYITLTIGDNELLFDAEIISDGVIRYTGVDIGCSNTKIIIGFRDADIKISEVILAYDPECEDDLDGYDYISSCMQYIGDESDINQCNVVVVASMDRPIEAFGFLWIPYFKLSFREHMVFHNTHHEGNENGYKYNSGENKRTAANTMKVWDVSINRVDSRIHDTIAIMVLLDWMYFVDSWLNTQPQQLYTGNEANYSGNWYKSEKTETAQGRFEVKRKLKSGRFMNNIV